MAKDLLESINYHPTFHEVKHEGKGEKGNIYSWVIFVSPPKDQETTTTRKLCISKNTHMEHKIPKL